MRRGREDEPERDSVLYLRPAAAAAVRPLLPYSTEAPPWTSLHFVLLLTFLVMEQQQHQRYMLHG